MKRVLVAAIALSTLLGSAAMADSHDRARGHQERHDSDRRDDHRHDSRHDSRRDDRSHYTDSRRSGYDHQRYRVAQYYRPQGYRTYVWHSGARLPSAYYAPRYIVHNYGTYRLRQPPRGYHWVRVDNDVVLAAIATGVVAQVVGGLFY
jgi:Ni/Co efflux regulator RcnB